MNKQGSFGGTQNRFRQHLQATKTAKVASIPTEQGVQESGSVARPSSDPEVKDMTLGGNPSEPAKTLADRGVPFDQKLPGAGEPPKEKKKRQETSPETALKEGSAESLSSISTRLMDNITKLASKTATEIGSEGGVPPIPSGGKSLELGTGEGVKGDATGSQNAPKIQGAEGVTQTDVSSAAAPKKLEQGTSQEAVKVALDLDKVAQDCARFSENVSMGRKMAHLLVQAHQGVPLSPAEQELAKEAQAVELEIVGKTANSIVMLGVDNGILSHAQAEALMKAAGFHTNPLYDAMANLQEKIATLRSAMPEQEAYDYFLKSASGELPPQAAPAPDAGGAPAPGGDAGAAPAGPVDPQEIHGAIVQLLQQLHQAVTSGQMTEQEAMQILKEHGIPVDEALAQGGAGAPGADAGGAPAGAPMAGGPEAAAALNGAMGAAPSGDPAGGAGAPPSPPSAPDAPSIAGEAPVMAEAAPAAPAAPKPDTKPKAEGGEKKEEKSESKSEKKEDKGEKKEKSDDDKKEARLLFGKLAAHLGIKLADPQIPGGPEAPVADAGTAATPPTADAGAPGGAGADAGGGVIEALMQDLEKAVQAGVVPAEVAQQFAQAIASGGGAGGAPGGAPAPSPDAGAPAPQA